MQDVMQILVMVFKNHDMMPVRNDMDELTKRLVTSKVFIQSLDFGAVGVMVERFLKDEILAVMAEACQQENSSFMQLSWIPNVRPSQTLGHSFLIGRMAAYETLGRKPRKTRPGLSTDMSAVSKTFGKQK